MNSRAERLAADLGRLEVDFLLVSAPVNVRYLTGYTGSNGLALVTAGGGRFYTDFRYETQSAEQVYEYFEREIIGGGDLLEAAAKSLGAAASGSARRLGIDDAHLTVKQHGRLTELLPNGWELTGCAGAVERLRAVKEPAEVAHIRAAAELIDEILDWACQQHLSGRTERELAIAIEHEMRVRGAQAPSFPSIVASGAHGALPHAEPRDVQIARGQLLTIDLGAVLDGYCSDCTRTLATGEIPPEQSEVYAIVLTAQEAALEALKPGLTGSEADGVAREIISQAGHGEHFGHGLGHGVGMEIHEAPRLSHTATGQVLEAGNVVTVEPGIYVPGSFGVRIEDLVVLTEDGHERLSHFPKDLLTIS